MSAITLVVAENTVRVISYQDMTPPIIQEQITAVCEDIFPMRLKSGCCLVRNHGGGGQPEGLIQWQPKISS